MRCEQRARSRSPSDWGASARDNGLLTPTLKLKRPLVLARFKDAVDGAYASDFTTKAYLNKYSKRGEPDADDRLTRSPGGYIWDEAIEHGLSFRTYGERERFIAEARRTLRRFGFAFVPEVPFLKTTSR